MAIVALIWYLCPTTPRRACRAAPAMVEKAEGQRFLERRPSGIGLLELEPQAKLHTARQVRTAGMQEYRRTNAAWIAGRRANRSAVHAVVNAIVLRVIEKVEVLPAKIECARFAEREALEIGRASCRERV